MFFGVLAIAIIFNITLALYFLVVLAALLFWEWLYHLPEAKRKSKDMGLDTLILIPINYYWACFLIWVSTKQYICDNPTQSYEVHIINQGKPSHKELLIQVEKDLHVIKKSVPGLLLWETSAPVPSSIRRIIRKAQKQGKAFWKKGGYFVPRFPGTEMQLQRIRRHGAMHHIPQHKSRR